MTATLHRNSIDGEFVAAGAAVENLDPSDLREVVGDYAVAPGIVMVNAPTAGVDYHVPFGGRKNSSYGAREQGRYAVEFFTMTKTAYTAPYA
jgi:acyl-CoA reductase-like NAD-dependent aldehyde dehydrogenase